MTLIDKDALLEKLSTFHPDYTFNITSFRNFIKAQPAAQPERKTGRWIKKNDVCSSPFDMTDRYVCSVCGLGYNWGSATSANYCPNCGARMEEEE